MATCPHIRRDPSTDGRSFPRSPAISRRTMVRGLGQVGGALLGGGLLLGGVTGCSVPGGPRSGTDPRERVPRERASCVPAAEMETYDRLGAARLRYEVNNTFTPVRIEPGFAAQLEAWLEDWNDLTGAAPEVLSNYGAWIGDDGSCDSWHHAGRAFDFAQLRAGGAPLVSCREDLWGDDPSPDQLQGYWALAASLHLHFAYVLTYLYDEAHANHIHVDNGRSGSGMSVFTGSSRVQNEAVQAICTHLWEEPVEVTGVWDQPTRDAVQGVLDRLEVDGRLTSQPVWQEFLRASLRQWRDAR